MTTATEDRTGPVRIGTFPQTHFLYVAMEVPQAELHTAIDVLVPKMADALKHSHATNIGPSLFIYAPSGNAAAPVRLEVGHPVAPGATPAPDAAIRVLPPFRCATMALFGDLLGHAPYAGRLYSQVAQRGLKASTEYREFHVYHEGARSDNNVTLLQVGLRD